MPRFLAEGIWEIQKPTDKDSVLVKSMKTGDRIAIKAAYTRKRGLPFDNRGQTVSVMAIKAVGTITGDEFKGSDPFVSPMPMKSGKHKGLNGLLLPAMNFWTN
jgi:5-methylcytosine-specific restriction protein B